ncbi:MAG: hypothetical protein AAGF67_01830 [Verrucomicrobiota bacterium]
MPYFPSPTPVAEMSDKEFAARIPNEISWVEFPLADRVVENVPQYFDSARYMRGRIERYQSGRDQLELAFRVGLSAKGNWGEVNFTGPLVILRMSRGVSVPAEEVVGREISLQFNEEGDLLAMNFLGIAVTHARVPLKGEKREVRALLETDDLFALFDENASEAVRRKAIDDATSFYFRPDKMALVDQDTTELMFFRVLQLMKEYGVVVQTMDTGPGMLELEGLALPEPAENPWIPVADWSTWGPTPPTQRAMKRE